MAYDTVELEATGGGGAKVLGDTFTDTDAATKFVAGGFLVYGAENGPYTRVTESVGLPIADAGGSITVDNADVTAAAASLDVLDDWDESDRAKVNLIAGQAGITAGAGSVGASTPRITLASDDPAVASLATLDNIVQVDDADFTDNTTPGVPVMGVYEATPSTVTDGDLGVVGITANRELRVAAGTNLNTSALALESGNLATIATDTTSMSGALSNIDANITACDTGAVVIASSALPSGASTSANQSTIITSLQLLDDAVATTGSAITTKGFAVSGTDGTNARVLKTDSSGELQIDVLSSALPSGAATETSVAAAATSLAIIDDWDETDRCKVNPIAGQAGVAGGSGATSALTQRVVLATDTTVPNVTGNIAHDTADSGNPVKVGGKAMNAMPTAVANGDRADFVADLFGRQLVSHIDPAQQVWKAVNYTSAQTGTTIWDPTSGKRIAITSIQIGAYGTTAGRVILWFGDNGDTTYTAGTDQVAFAGSFAPGADSKPGAVIEKNIPIFCNTADRELHITTDAAISIDVTVYGYEY